MSFYEIVRKAKPSDEVIKTGEVIPKPEIVPEDVL